MGLSAEVGTFSAKTSTGSQVVSLSDGTLTPKVLIIWGCNVLADGFGTANQMIFGMWADDSNKQAAMHCFDLDTKGTTESGRRWSESKIITRVTGGFSVVQSAAVSSVASGSFTLSWTAVQGDARLFNYLVLGGDDITNVDINHIGSPTSPQAVSYNVGFEPDCAIVLSTKSSSAGNASHKFLCVGLATATDQATVSATSVDALGTSQTDCRYKSARFVELHDQSDAESEVATISFDADGYDLDWTAVSGTARRYAVLAIKGIQATLADTTSTNSQATQSVTGAPAEPVAALLMTAGNASAAIPNDIGVSIGAGAGASQQAMAAVTSEDGVGTTVCDRSQEQDEVLQMLGMNQAVNEEANWGGVTSNGFDLNWTTNDATQRYFAALMFSPAAAATARLRTLMGVGA